MLIPFDEVREVYPAITGPVLHVGAHECQEADEYERLGLLPVYWVEGNRDVALRAADALNAREKTDFHTIYLAVVSDADGQELTFHITSFDQSSSILPLGTHATRYPEIVEAESRTVYTTSIDTLLTRDVRPRQAIKFLNLDIQGAELLALQGMGVWLEEITGIYTEVNFEEVYQGCALIGQLDDFLGARGFTRLLTHDTGQGWGDAFYGRTA